MSLAILPIITKLKPSVAHSASGCSLELGVVFLFQAYAHVQPQSTGTEGLMTDRSPRAV